MGFRITGLSPAPFFHLFGLPEAALAALGAIRYVATAGSRFPDRIEIRDAAPGETVLLVNYEHQPADTPYRARHAIFVREHAAAAFDAVEEIPPAMRTRPLSLRAFDAAAMMIGSTLAEGDAVPAAIGQLLANADAAYIQAHYAGPGCYAARIERP